MIIQNKTIGDNNPCFIIAEAGINHNGDLKLAGELVLRAAEAGADAIKFQTHLPQHEMLRDGTTADYVGESLFDLLKRVSLSKKDHLELQKLAKENNIIFMSTPFSREAADFLEEIEVPVFKTGSGEFTNIPLQKHIAQKRRPMIISTGMSTVEEIDETIHCVRSINSNFALMHCTSTYPTPYEHVNLNFISELKNKYKVPIGLSDHTMGIYVALASISLGANLIEKHFTLSRDLPGPDQKASIEPAELKELVRGIRAIERALGSDKKIQPGEQEVRNMAHHSVVSLKDIPMDKIISSGDVWVKRPGTGISAKDLSKVIGKKAKRTIFKNSLIKWEDLQ